MAAVVEAVAAAARLGMTAIVNPAPALALPEELLAHRPILVPNEHELPACVGAPDGEAAIASLRQRQITVVVTRGAAGCLLVDGESRVEMPAAPPAAVLDTTGAGDTFCGVLAAWLAEGRPIREAAQAATVAAGLSVAAPGPRAGMPDRRELELALHALTEVDPT